MDGGRSFGFSGSACLRLWRTGSAVFLAGVILSEPVRSGAAAWRRHRAPVFLQLVSARAGVFVRYRIEAEVHVRECAIGAVGFVEDRDVRADLAVIEPSQHLAGAIGRVGGQAFRLQGEGVLRPVPHGPCHRVILPVLTRRDCRTHAAILSFMAGVTPPRPMLGRSVL